MNNTINITKESSGIMKIIIKIAYDSDFVLSNPYVKTKWKYDQLRSEISNRCIGEIKSYFGNEYKAKISQIDEFIANQVDLEIIICRVEDEIVSDFIMNVCKIKEAANMLNLKKEIGYKIVKEIRDGIPENFKPIQK